MALEQTAQRLIQAKGRTVTLVISSTTPADVNKPWRAPSSVVAAPDATRLAVKAVFESKSSSDIARALASGGEQDAVRRSVERFLVAALDVASFDILATDFVEDGESVRWRVTKVIPVQPGDTAYIHTLEVEQ
jgi:hypothetical protein